MSDWQAVADDTRPGSCVFNKPGEIFTTYEAAFAVHLEGLIRSSPFSQCGRFGGIIQPRCLVWDKTNEFYLCPSEAVSELPSLARVLYYSGIYCTLWNSLIGSLLLLVLVPPACVMFWLCHSPSTYLMKWVLFGWHSSPTWPRLGCYKPTKLYPDWEGFQCELFSSFQFSTVRIHFVADFISLHTSAAKRCVVLCFWIKPVICVAAKGVKFLNSGLWKEVNKQNHHHGFCQARSSPCPTETQRCAPVHDTRGKIHNVDWCEYCMYNSL